MDIRRENTTKYIALREAARISGYAADYIGYLIRKGKIEGKSVYTNVSWQIAPEVIIKYCIKMKNLEIRDSFLLKKKSLSLKEAAVISGYTPDYIGSLIRKGKLTGKKVYSGVSWMVNEKDIKKYQEKIEAQKLKSTKNWEVLKFVSDFFPPIRIPVKIQESTKKISGNQNYQTKRLKFFGFSWRASLVIIILLSLLGIGPLEILQKIVGAITQEEKTVSFYSTLCEGDPPNGEAGWQNPENVQGQPDVDSSGDLDSFSESNSAVYKGGSLNLICQNFEKNSEEIKDEDLVNLKIQSAKIKLSFAIGEKKPDLEIPQSLPEESAPETPGESAPLIPEESIPPPSEQPAPAEEEPLPIEQPQNIETPPEVVPPPELVPPSQSVPPSESAPPVENTAPSAGLFKKIKNLFGVLTAEAQEGNIPTEETTPLIEEATPAAEGILSPTENINTPTQEVITPNLDTKIIIWYSLDNETWWQLADISQQPISNLLNGGYFSYDAPFLKSFEDVKNLKIKLEGVKGGETTEITYLDSVFVELNYIKEETETIKIEEPKKIPKVKVMENSLLMPELRKDFSVEEDPTFLISEPEVSPDELITDKKVEMIEEIELPAVSETQKAESNGILERAQETIEETIDTIKEKILEPIIEETVTTPEVEAQETKVAEPLLNYKNEVKVKIFGPDGAEINVLPTINNFLKDGKETFEIKIQKPSDREFRPGLYKLEIEFETEKAIYILEQDFAWGVLAINTNKSIYPVRNSISNGVYLSSGALAKEDLPPETAYLQMAALASDGHTICDANLKLEIISPQGNIIFPEIQKSGECGPSNVTDVPDYFTYYQIGEPEIYEMKLTNLDNNYEITDSFEVRDFVPFDVERIGPTRIYPPATYEMKFKIKANQDFQDQVIEVVPESFEILEIQPTETGSLSRVQNGKKEIVWQVDWKAGEEYELKYQFDVPDISPYLYLLGPLTMKQFDNEIIFSETRQWQIAADSPDTETLYPTAVGTYTQCLDYPSAGDNYTKVDETPSDDDTTYVYSFTNSSVEKKDLYGLQDTTATGTIISVTVYIRVRDPDAGGGSAKTFLRSGTTESTGATNHPPTSYTLYSTNYTTDPNTPGVGWTISAINALQIGVKLTSAYDPEIPQYYPIRCTQVYAVVEYTAAVAPTISGSSDMRSGTVAVAVNNTLQSGKTGTISAVDGTWSITSVTVSSGDIVTVWVDGAADDDESTAVTKYDGSEDITGMVLNRHVLSLGSVDNPSLTVTNLGSCDNNNCNVTGDDNIMHSVISSVLNVDDDNAYTNEKIDILSGATLTIATGETLTTHDLAINGSLTSSGSGTFNVSGSWDNNNDFNASTTETINFTSTTTETIDSTGATDSDVYNTIFNGSGGQWTLTTALVVNDQLTVTAGTVTGSQNLTVGISNGAIVCGATCGTINLTGGTTTLQGAGNFGTAALASNWTFSSLTFGDGSNTKTTTSQGTGTITVSSVLTIGTNHTLDAGSKTWILSGTGTPFVTTGGTFTSNASTVKYTGNNSTTIAAATYNNLELSPSANLITFTLASGIINTTGYLTIGNGTNTGTINADTNDPTLNVDGDFTIASNATFVASATGTFSVGGSWSNSNTFTHSSGTVTFDAGSTGKTITPGSSNFYNVIFNNSNGGWSPSAAITITNDLTMTAGTLSGIQNITVNGNAIGTAGVIDITGGTFEQRVAAAKNFGPTTASTNWTFSSLTFSNSTAGLLSITTQSCSTCGVTVSSVLTIGKVGDGAATYLDTGDKTWTLSGTGTPFVINGSSYIDSNTSTFNYTGDDATTIKGTTYYNLQAGNATTQTGARTYTLGGNTGVNNILTVGPSTGSYTQTLDTSSYTLTLSGTGTPFVINSKGSFTASTNSTVDYDGDGTTTITATTYYNLTFTPGLNVTGRTYTGGGDIFVNNNLTMQPGAPSVRTLTFNLGGSLSVNNTIDLFYSSSAKSTLDTTATNYSLTSANITIRTNSTLNARGSTVTITGSGTPFTVSGTFTYGTSTVVYTGDGDTNITATTYNNLEFSPTITDNRVYTGAGAINVGGTLNINPTASSALSLTFNLGNTTSVTGLTTIQTTTSATSILSTTASNYSLTVGSLSIQSGGTLTGNASALDSNGDVTIASGGTLTSTSVTFNVGGSWSNSGTFTHSSGTVIFDAITTGKTISDGGDPFYGLQFTGASGGWTYTDGCSTAPNTTVVNASSGTATFINAKTATSPTVSAGTLNVDWYLGVRVIDAATSDPVDPIEDIPDGDITISENSGTPQSTVWKYSGGWGDPLTSQATGTDSDGNNPQPTSAGAIRIREYSNTSGSPTYYLYNLHIAWQSTYGEYDYHSDYGTNYLTSTANSGDHKDAVIGAGWHRTTVGEMNTVGAVNAAPTNGSWYVGMLKGLEVTITGTSIDFGTLDNTNDFTAQTAPVDDGTTIKVTTSAASGYIVTAWEDGLMTCSNASACASETILNFTHGSYDNPEVWDTSCNTDPDHCGFGFTSSDPSVGVGNPSRYSNATAYTFFPIESSAPVLVMDFDGPVASKSYLITYRISTSSIQRPGPYETTIVYVVTAQY
jgi:hypothetical protein